ncbi:hypothetical protein B296_00022437 [Ensete ventricosum]|uniref:Uncharacterized protein n=1 Tax=Ensete ventricosum TaxID=4639 RepID=A0A426Y3S8_ENSVE|nr:hypothetical protein B296_00022437 [Ensete ventricosum]
MLMGSPKEKRTTGASSASTPAKAPPSTSTKAPREEALPATALVPPEWSASLQAFYDRGAAAAAVMPQAFYSPSPVAAAQPVVWGAQVRCLIFLGGFCSGEGSHSFDTAGNSGNAGRVRTAKKLPVSAPGRAALPGPPTNLNIGMDFWGASPAGPVPTQVGSNGLNSGPVMIGWSRSCMNSSGSCK